MTHSSRTSGRGSRLAVVGWIAVCAVPASGCGSPYLLTVEDRVCRAGDKTRLVGKLEYRGVAILNKGAEDRHVTFYLDGRLLDTEQTGEDGYAQVKHRFEEPGAHRLVVALERRGDRKCETSATVFVWQEKDPILIVDVDGTLESTRKRYLISRSAPDWSPPKPDAAEVLSDLARVFHIVYLTGRPREWIPKTREWLQRNGFPLGPLLTWDVDKDPWSRKEFKAHRIDDLQDAFDGITIGIGNARSDHDAYRERQLFTILLEPDRPPHAIRRGAAAPDWSAVRELFARNPHLYDKEHVPDGAVALPWPSP